MKKCSNLIVKGVKTVLEETHNMRDMVTMSNLTFESYGGLHVCSVNALDASKETPELQGVPPGLKVITPSSTLLLHINCQGCYIQLLVVVCIQLHSIFSVSFIINSVYCSCLFMNIDTVFLMN